MRWWLALPGLVALTATEAAAQIDYRNLDDERPVAVEDAYPIERYAFEVLGSYRFARLPGGGGIHVWVPELSYGVAKATSIGVKAPFAVTTRRGATDFGLAGVRDSRLGPRAELRRREVHLDRREGALRGGLHADR